MKASPLFRVKARTNFSGVDFDLIEQGVVFTLTSTFRDKNCSNPAKIFYLINCAIEESKMLSSFSKSFKIRSSLKQTVESVRLLESAVEISETNSTLGPK